MKVQFSNRLNLYFRLMNASQNIFKKLFQFKPLTFKLRKKFKKVYFKLLTPEFLLLLFYLLSFFVRFQRCNFYTTVLGMNVHFIEIFLKNLHCFAVGDNLVVIIASRRIKTTRDAYIKRLNGIYETNLEKVRVL